MSLHYLLAKVGVDTTDNGLKANVRNNGLLVLLILSSTDAGFAGFASGAGSALAAGFAGFAGVASGGLHAGDLRRAGGPVVQNPGTWRGIRITSGIWSK